MSVKQAAQEQYKAILDHAASQAGKMITPRRGWLRTARDALGMSGAQLARRMGVTRARIGHAEQAELNGSITLKSIQAAAEAMGYRFVYAIIPEVTVDEIIVAQARKKASALVSTARIHMALESQSLSDEKNEQEITRLARDLAHDMRSDFWDNN